METCKFLPRKIAEKAVKVVAKAWHVIEELEQEAGVNHRNERPLVPEAYKPNLDPHSLPVCSTKRMSQIINSQDK